jgi:hypothetical protein
MTGDDRGGLDLPRLETWKKRFRLTGDQKPTVQVQTTSRLETMTVTQEWRFNELQRVRFEEVKGRKSLPDRPWYTLAEANQRLATGTGRLLRAGAAGQLNCYVATDGLRGCWGGPEDADTTSARADISHLRLLPAACRDIEAYGSVNVTVLAHPTAQGKGARFHLREPLWVAPERLLLKHPLPPAGRY